MPLYIKVDETAALVATLAKRRGIIKQEAVRFSVEAELDRDTREVPLRERMRA